MPGRLGTCSWEAGLGLGNTAAHRPSGGLRKPINGQWDFRDPGVLHHGCDPPGRANKLLAQLKHGVVVVVRGMAWGKRWLRTWFKL